MMRSAVMAVLAMFALAHSQEALAGAQFKLRASVDTSSTHGRTLAIGDYLKKLQEKSSGRIETELFHSGQLFRDRDVVKALRQGAVEMAVPGTWVLTAFVPDADVFQLPAFFGQPYPVVYAAADGKIGEIINKQFESKLDVKLLGPFVPERGKILPRRISGTCAMHQRKLRTAIMRARQLALIPYTAE